MTITIDDLYPYATPQERADAQQALDDYLRLVIEVYETRRVDERGAGFYDD